MTLMIFHFEFSYHVSPRVLGSATEKKIFPPSLPLNFDSVLQALVHFAWLLEPWSGIYRLTRPFEAAGRLDEAFPSCKTYSCVKEKERASEIAEWIRRILYNNIFV